MKGCLAGYFIFRDVFPGLLDPRRPPCYGLKAGYRCSLLGVCGRGYKEWWSGRTGRVFGKWAGVFADNKPSL